MLDVASAEPPGVVDRYFEQAQSIATVFGRLESCILQEEQGGELGRALSKAGRTQRIAEVMAGDAAAVEAIAAAGAGHFLPGLEELNGGRSQAEGCGDVGCRLLKARVAHRVEEIVACQSRRDDGTAASGTLRGSPE